MAKLQITVLPKSSLGKWALGLTVAFVVLLVLHQTIAASVRQNPVLNPGAPNQLIFLTIVASYLSGIAAFVIGLISIIKSKERSILVFLVVGIILIALLLLLAEI